MKSMMNFPNEPCEVNNGKCVLRRINY
jgi:hypothetical protein